MSMSDLDSAETDTMQGSVRGGFCAFGLAEIDDTISGRLDRIVDQHRHSTAVVGRDAQLTYEELDRAAAAVAKSVRRISGSAAGPVSVMMPQGVAAVVAIVGVLKAGKFYVPFDPGPPAAWVGGVLNEIAPDVVLTDTAHVEHVHSIAPRDATVVDVASLLPDFESALSRRSASDPDRIGASDAPAHHRATEIAESGAHGQEVRVSPDSEVRVLPGRRDASEAPAPDATAYVFFTSGTTGRPKGVMDSHRNVLHNVMRYTNPLSISRHDRLTLLQPIGFSGSVSSLFCALMNGAAVYPVDMRRETGASLAEWIRRNQITIYHSVPSIFRSVVGCGGSFPSVRVVRLEGDQASVRDLELFREGFERGSILVNGLGLTETGIVTQYVMDRDTRLESDVVPVGFPCDGIAVEVVDEENQSVPIGQVGEIVVTSRYLATGYWGDAGLTRNAFTAVAGDGAARRYRTGDLGRLSKGGWLEHLGRIDGRVRLAGQWIEPSVIENMLVRTRGVAEAAVAVKGVGTDHSVLAAFLVRDRGARTSEAISVPEIRERLQSRLPGHVIPSRYVEVAVLPVTPNGKVDRRALPALDRSRPQLRAAYLAPVGSLQQRLAEIWSELLGIDDIGVRDDFFELGGNSLLALAMLGRVEQYVERRISPDVLLLGATIERLSDSLVGDDGRLRSPVSALQPSGELQPFFYLHGDYLSGGFYSIELARRLGPGRPFYALRPCGLGGESIPGTYSEMAERHVAEMKTIQPRGPYLLGGLCNGGLVAYEMARLLRTQGERVSMLIMIDASAVNLRFVRWKRLLSVLGWVGVSQDARERLFMRLRAASLAVADRPVLEGAAIIAQKLRKGVVRAAATSSSAGRNEIVISDDFDAASPTTVSGHWARYRAAYQRIDHLYVPDAYDGPVVLLWPEEKEIESVDEAGASWQRVCPQIVVRAVPGDVLTSHTRHLPELADAIRESLEGLP